MLRLGLGGCRSLLLLVAWSCKSPFLVKYWVRYLGTSLFNHLKTGIQFCIFLMGARFNQLSTWKVSFEMFCRNTIRAARFCRRGSFLQHPSEIPLQCNVSIIKEGLQEWHVYQFRGFQREAWSYTRQKPKPPTDLAIYILDVIFPCQKGSLLKQHLNS